MSAVGGRGWLAPGPAETCSSRGSSAKASQPASRCSVTTAIAPRVGAASARMSLSTGTTLRPLFDLARIARDLARAWQLADAAAPLHPSYGANGRGIGPYDEKQFVLMLREQLVRIDRYYESSAVEVHTQQVPRWWTSV